MFGATHFQISFLGLQFILSTPTPNMTPEEWQQARLIGEDDDDEQIESADDEDLDSDAAFDESDEERFAGFFSSKVRYCFGVLKLILTF